MSVHRRNSRVPVHYARTRKAPCLNRGDVEALLIAQIKKKCIKMIWALFSEVKYWNYSLTPTRIFGVVHRCTETAKQRKIDRQPTPLQIPRISPEGNGRGGLGTGVAQRSTLTPFYESDILRVLSQEWNKKKNRTLSAACSGIFNGLHGVFGDFSLFWEEASQPERPRSNKINLDWLAS